MIELIAPFEHVYRSKLDYDIWSKYILIHENDRDNWEIVREDVVKNSYNRL